MSGIKKIFGVSIIFNLFYSVISLVFSSPVHAQAIVKPSTSPGSIAIPSSILENWAITSIGEFVGALITFLFVIAALLVFGYLVWGGVEWITSGGDKSKTQQARDRITAALVGLAIVATAYAIIVILQNFFGFDITKLKIPTPWDPAGEGTTTTE